MHTHTHIPLITVHIQITPQCVVTIHITHLLTHCISTTHPLTHTHTLTYIHINHTHTHILIHTHILTHPCTATYTTHTHTHPYTHTHTYTPLHSHIHHTPHTHRNAKRNLGECKQIFQWHVILATDQWSGRVFKSGESVVSRMMILHMVRSGQKLGHGIYLGTSACVYDFYKD